MKTFVPMAVLAVTAAVLAGCGSESSGPKRQAPSSSAASKPTTTPATTSAAAGQTAATGDELDPQVQDFVTEFKQVQQALETYWVEKIDGYEKPGRTIVFGGKSDDPTSFPTCGGEQVEAENGFYCPPDNTVILDAEWMYDEYNRIGDSFLYVVLAHEYGHSAQANLSDDTKPAEADEELQADCFSGSFWQESIDNRVFDEEDGDEQEVNQTLVSVAGDFGTTDNHGTLAARAGAFEYGRKNSAEGCLNTDEYVRS